MAGLTKATKHALFLDRDGVINRDHGYTHKVADLEFMPGVFELIQRATAANVDVFVVTNQAGIARGFYDEDAMHEFNDAIAKEVRQRSGEIKRFYFCPHHVDGVREGYSYPCSNRKPKPGMLLRAQQDFDIDLKESVIVGDRESDIEAGRNAGLKAGYLFVEAAESSNPDYVAKGYVVSKINSLQTVADLEGW
jgi:D-glycero-D-manno-heptose 1,7-bisphosphate phosphatase